MDRRAIGVFDSGVGGLTVVRALLDLLPRERIVYLGDTARLPYGSKSEKTILRFSRENTEFLLSQAVKCVVVACNTVTALALDDLKSRFELPIIGVIEPGAKRASEVSQTKRIGVIGTKQTIGSGAYQKAIQRVEPRAEVFSQACPLLVPLIEENWLEHRVTELVVREYLDPLIAKGIDTLVLGCTHYPLLAGVINLCYPELYLVDSGENTAGCLDTILSTKGLGSDLTRQAEVDVWLTDYSSSFQELAERILGRDLNQIRLIGDGV